jgi:hypothetical protein
MIIVNTGSVPESSLYNSILQDIYDVTLRPELVNETAVALRKATMKAHLADLWKNDLVVVYPSIPAMVANTAYSYRLSLDLTDATTFPLLRRICTIKEFNNPLTGYELQFKEVEPDNILDEYLVERVNYWYQAGRQIQLRTTKALAGLQVDYWKFPNVIPAQYDSWIAAQFPDLIVEEACAQIYRIIGKLDEATKLAANWVDNLSYLQSTVLGLAL